MKKFENIWKEATAEADLKYDSRGILTWGLLLKEALKKRIEPLIEKQKFEEEISKMGLQILKYCEEIARLQKSLRKKNKAIRELNEAVKKNKARLKECEKLRIEANNEAASEYSRKCEVAEERAELKRENQRLRAENLSLKTFVEDAKKQQPEIAEFVAKVIEERGVPEDGVTKDYSIGSYNFEKVSEWIEKHQRSWLLALLNGYTVAKEKRFYLREKNTGFYLNKGKNAHLELVSNPYFDKNNEFIQQEIDSMEIGSYEQIEVEEEGE